MTSLNGYIQGLGGGEKRTVDKQGKEIKLSVFDNIDRVIVFNEAGETSQTTLTGRNLFNISQISSGSVSGVDYDVDVDTGMINVSGQSTGSGWKSILNFTLPETGTYHFHLERTGNAGYFLERFTSLGADATVVCNDITTVYRLAIGSFATGETYEGTISKIQVEKGSTPTDYEPYCGGVPSPNPDYPQAVEGIGVKQLDGTYKVSIDYWDDDRSERITASGLAYPLYEGDVLDFVNGKVIRANGYVDLGSLTWVSENSVVTGLARAQGTGIKWQSIIFSEYFIYSSVTSYSRINNGEIALTNSESTPILRIRWEDWGSYSDAQIKTALDGVIAVCKLPTPIDEYITLTGDISEIGTATVEADGTLTVKYDKAEMAVRKYSAKPDWGKIGYSDTPQFILDAFDYSKQIYDSWTSAASYASAYRGDKALKFFPDVDITGSTNYSAMFQESGLIYAPPLAIGDDTNTNVNCQWMFQSSPIEDVEMSNDSETQKVVLDSAFKSCSYLKKAKLNLSATGSMASAFADCTRLQRIEDGLDTSAVTSLSEAFRACSSLVYLYELDLSSCTTCYRAFQNCTSLEHAPNLRNIRTGGNFQQMFWNCSSLKTLPPYNLHTPNNLTNMFQGTGSNLDEASRRNILSMLAACTYSGTKTLAHLGFNSSMYSAASWQALPNYNDFVSAGWSIGYS